MRFNWFEVRLIGSYRQLRIHAQPLSNRRGLSYVQGQTRAGDSRTREYFYYVDHHGQLFLDDTKVKNFVTCFKDPGFLSFFFKRLKVNDTQRYQKQFPFISPCGRELNYIRCEDIPVVFTHIVDASTKEVFDVEKCHSNALSSRSDDMPSGYGGPTNDPDISVSDGKTVSQRFLLSYGGTTAALRDLCVPFEPWAVIMDESNGRIYHPGPSKAGGVGLIKSSLAIQIASGFVYPKQEPATGVGHVSKPTHFIWNGIKYTLDYKLAANNLLSHVKH